MDHAGRKRILVVDNDPRVREILHLAMEDSGHKVDTSPDGELAWGALLSNNYDVLVTDEDDGSKTRCMASEQRIPVISCLDYLQS
jgi:DNA-binding response OmpR family regulator